jgi:hypothetical protein
MRDLAKDYFPIIQPWSVDLVEDSVSGRHLCSKNTGKLARVGVSPGSRHAKLFGWVRNLQGRHRKENNETKKHDINISSLFGFFYALVRAQVPNLTDTFETIIKESGIVKLDKYNAQQFTLPFNNDVLTFSQSPLAPPEGYLSVNFMKQIHKDSHWPGCPWGVYWNLLRHHPGGQTGKERGGSFFVAQYGLRVLNDSNTCVLWNVSHFHGTGMYEDGLKQVGIFILLSKDTQTTWDQYKKKVMNQELDEDDLLWYADSESSS